MVENVNTNRILRIGGGGILIRSNVLEAHIGADSLVLAGGPGGTPTGRAHSICHAASHTSTSIDARLSLHNRAIRRTVTGIRLFVSGYILGGVSRVEVVRNGNANTLHTTIARRLGNRPGITRFELNICNRNRDNMAVTGLG